MANRHTNITKLRHYKKILAVQDKYKEVYKERMTLTYIHLHHIEPEFFISYSTFYNYLNVNAKREIRLLEEIIQNS